jgi:perosamine synthetase
MKKEIPIFKPIIAGNEKKYLQECVETKWFSSRGPFVEKFEKLLSDYIGVKYALSTSNCTTALHLALKAIGIEQGDEVICPALTFISPIHMVSLAGATPVLVDIEEDTWNIDPEKVKESITNKTKAILVIHAFGQSAKMDKILNIAKENNLYVIEDVAEALGATFEDKNLGSMGHVSCFSFFGNKIITSGEGGMALTNDVGLYEKMSSLSEYGRNKEERYLYDDIGFNYRMTNIQAAVGLAQLEKIDYILKVRHKQLLLYEKMLSGVKSLYIRTTFKRGESVHWLMTLFLKEKNKRDRLIDSLLTKGIETRKMIYPAYHSKPYESMGNEKTFPVAEKISLNSLHLPSSTDLTEKEIFYIVDSIKQSLKEIKNMDW